MPQVPGLVQWDIEFNRPVVAGNIEHPKTGELVKAGGKGFHTGPPAIHTFWYNLHGGEGLFRGAGAVFPVSLEKLYLEVGKHIAAGKYTIFSINVTEFSFVILCYSKMTDEEGTAMLREIFM